MLTIKLGPCQLMDCTTQMYILSVLWPGGCFGTTQNPFRLIPPEELETHGPTVLQDVATISKSHQDFQRLVLDTMVAQKDTPHYFHLIIGSTPRKRNRRAGVWSRQFAYYLKVREVSDQGTLPIHMSVYY